MVVNVWCCAVRKWLWRMDTMVFLLFFNSVLGYKKFEEIWPNFLYINYWNLHLKIYIYLFRKHKKRGKEKKKKKLDKKVRYWKHKSQEREREWWVVVVVVVVVVGKEEESFVKFKCCMQIVFVGLCMEMWNGNY